MIRKLGLGCDLTMTGCEKLKCKLVEMQMIIQSALSRPTVADRGSYNGTTQFRNADGRSVLDNLCRPSLVQMQSNLFALQFDLMKIVPARFILETFSCPSSSPGFFAPPPGKAR